MSKDKKEAKETRKKTKISGMEGGTRINDMSATAEVIEEIDVTKVTPDTTATKTKVKNQKFRGKKYQTAKKQIDPLKYYPLKEAFSLLKKINLSKDDSSVEIHLVVLNKGISGEINLPYYRGKTKNIIIYEDNILTELESGKINFDVLLASPTDMPKLLPFAKLLGPKGLMPNPKNNTLVADPKKALAGFSSTAVHYKTEKDYPLIHLVIGKINQKEDELIENFKTLIKSINPKNIKKAVLKTTISPAIKVSL